MFSPRSLTFYFCIFTFALALGACAIPAIPARIVYETPTDFVRLEEAGLRGNGHMVMIEKNNLDIAAMIDRWVSQNVR